MRIELDLIKSEDFINFFFQKSPTVSDPLTRGDEQAMKANYYLKTIDKILNKCVFNGDSKCNCKKC